LICECQLATATAPPTLASNNPTSAPTYWFQQDGVDASIQALQSQVNGLAAGEVINRNLIARIEPLAAQVSTLASRLDRQQVEQANVNWQLAAADVTLGNQINQTRSTIVAAVTSFTSVTATYVADDTVDAGCGQACAPTVQAEGTSLKLNAPGGSVRISTQRCGEVDPCQAHNSLNAVAAAMEALRTGF
jgi:hypothetical protein